MEKERTYRVKPEQAAAVLDAALRGSPEDVNRLLKCLLSSFDWLRLGYETMDEDYFIFTLVNLTDPEQPLVIIEVPKGGLNAGC